MPIWLKLIAATVLLGLLAAGMLYRMDAYGVRRGCFAAEPDQARFQAARDLQARAGEAIRSHNYAAANDMLDLALSGLGDRYLLGHRKDETAETAAAARAVAQSQPEIAARMKYDVMTRRAGMFQRKTRLSAYCHDMARRWRLI